MLEITALLLVALLFGGMVLYSFGFAAALFTSLPAEQAGLTLRKTFPHFYTFVMVCAGLSAALMATFDFTSALYLVIIAASTWPTRQKLMPAINLATDQGNKGRFKTLHGLSVLITLAHIALSALVLTRFVA